MSVYNPFSQLSIAKKNYHFWWNCLELVENDFGVHSKMEYIWWISFLGYSPLGSPAALKSDILKNPVVTEIAERLGKTPAQVALRWGLQAGHSVLPKSTNESRIKGNFDIFDWSIPQDLMTKISEIKQASS